MAYKHQIKKITWLFLLLLPLQSPVLNAQNLMHINTGWTAPVSLLLERITQAMFKRANIDLEFSELPGERSIYLAASGISDGDCCRIPRAIEKDYPELLQVPEVVYVARFSAFSKQPQLKNITFEALKPYNIATIAGWKILVINLKRIKPETLHVMNDAQAMFKVLEKNRIDVATYGYLSGLKIIKELGLTDISAIDPPLASLPLYLYLNKKHKLIIPELTNALKALKEEGEIERIIKEFTS